jgi:hypothetical protein
MTMTVSLPKRGPSALKRRKSFGRKPMLASKQKEAAADHAIMEKKVSSKHIISDLKALIAWRAGKPCPSKVKGKDEFVALWNDAKKIPVPTFEAWSEAGEQALLELEETAQLEGAIALEDTDCGWLARQRQHECVASVADMNPENIVALEQMIAATKGRVSIG